MKNKYYWFNKNIFGFGLTSFFNDFSHEMTTAILPAFIQSIVGTAFAPQALGIVSSLSNAISTFFKLLSGVYSDRITRYKPILILGYTITPIFVALIGTANSLWQITIYKTIAWTGRGIREPIRDKWLTISLNTKDYGKAFGLIRAMDTLGAIAGPLIAFYAISYFSLRTIFFISFIPGFFSIISIILFISDAKTEQFGNTKLQKYSEQFKELPKKFIYFVLIALIFGLGNFNKTLLIYRALELFSVTKNSSIIATGTSILLYIVFNIIRAISEFLIGYLSDYTSRKNLLAILGFGFFGAATFLGISQNTSIFLWILIFILAGISTATVTTLQKAYAADLLPANIRGTGYGLLQMIDGVGDFLSSFIVGIFWSHFSVFFAFIYSGVISILSMFLLLFF